jgi:hypothetical protein
MGKGEKMSIWNALGNIYGTVWAVNILKSGFSGKPLKNFGMPGVPKFTKKQKKYMFGGIKL